MWLWLWPCHDATIRCAIVGRALVGSPGHLWAGPLRAPSALEGRALVGHPGLLWAHLRDGLAPVAPKIGHSPRDDRLRVGNWIWLWLGQLHGDPRSVKHKRCGCCVYIHVCIYVCIYICIYVHIGRHQTATSRFSGEPETPNATHNTD